MERKLFSILIAVAICLGLSTEFADRNSEQNTSALPFPIHVNGKPIGLEDAFVKDNKSYVSLRELCEKMGLTVKWVDPDPLLHRLPYPGGNFPVGINIVNPTFVYTKQVPKFDGTEKIVKGVDITGIFMKYREGEGYQYYFTRKGFVVDTGKKQIFELDYIPSYELMYVSVEEFKEKIQPYLIDICMQN